MPVGAQSILVCVDSTQPLTIVEATIERCGLTARPIAESELISAARGEDDCGIALVGLASIPQQHSRALEALRHLKQQGYTVLCFAAGAGEWPLGIHCRLLLWGAAHVLDTAAPAFPSELRERIIGQLHADREFQREEQQLVQQMRDLGLVGRGPGMMHVYRSIQRVSPLSDVPVLISGETGTGKELVARSIHRLDPRRCNEPFIPVNCSAISSGLAESQLFGHRRGAFTGADHYRTGLIRAARGGVLFLDEIGDLEPGLQGKLLRVLQEHRVLALGEDHEVPVRARVIAATNRNLEAMVRDQTFRSDLFHRLNVLSIRVPALRERREDVEALVRHFVEQTSGASAVPVSDEFVEALRNVEMRGNVRELENIVQRAMVTRINGESLGLGNLQPELWLQIAGVTTASHQPAGRERPDTGNGQAPQMLDVQSVLAAGRGTLSGALALCEQEIITAALRMSRGNRSRAARLLGISARSIFNKMRKHRISA